MISKETLALVNTFKPSILEGLKIAKDEVYYFFDSGLAPYIESQRSKYLNAKTFLFRHEPINFYSIYFPVSLSLNNGKKTIKSDINIMSIFNTSNYVSIIGAAGSGKTMFMKYIFLNCIDSKYKIPIVVELRSFNNFQGNFNDFIIKYILNNKISPNNLILERLLADGKFLFLLDGFDEIFSDNKQKIVSEMEIFIDKYHHNFFVITSRPGVDIEGMPRFSNYLIKDLSIEDIEQFIYLQHKQDPDNIPSEKIIESLKRKENSDYSTFLGSPLLLSMFILTFNSYPELPTSKSKFYWNVFDTLCTKHDSVTKKGGWQHERRSGLQNETIELILKWFSYTSLFNGKYDFDEQYMVQTIESIKDKLKLKFDVRFLIEDLLTTISIILKDGLVYRFPHKSLQEYFTASLIKGLNNDEKNQVYSKKLRLSNITANGINSTFWNLCRELDKESFYNYFIIPSIDTFLEGYLPLSDYDKTFKFLNDFSSSTTFSIQGETVFVASSAYSSPSIIKVLEFMMLEVDSLFITSIYNYDSKIVYPFVKKFIESDLIKDVNMPELTQKHYSINFYNLPREDVFTFANQSGMVNRVKTFLANVEGLLFRIKSELADEAQRELSLLGL